MKSSPSTERTSIRKSRCSRRWRRVILVVSCALFALAGAEFFFRVQFGELLVLQKYPLVYQPDPQIGYRYVPNTEGEIRIPGHSKRFRINSNGYCNAAYPVKKTPGTLRVAVLDSSEGTGIWMTGSRNFCERMQDELRRRGHAVEVLNFSIDGRARDLWRLRQSYTEVLAYQPDYLLFRLNLPLVQSHKVSRQIYRGYVIHYDPEAPLSALLARDRVDRLESHRVLTFLHKNSYCVRAAARFIARRLSGSISENLDDYIGRHVGSSVPAVRMEIDDSLDLVAMVSDQLREHGVRMFFYQYTVDHKTERALDAAGLGAQNWPLAIPPESSYAGRYDGHLNERAHALAARRFVEYLETDLESRHALATTTTRAPSVSPRTPPVERR